MTDDEIIAALRARVADGRPTDFPRSAQPPEPVSDEAIRAAEAVVGMPLPPLARRFYREVANGGVGPFSGIESLDGNMWTPLDCRHPSGRMWWWQQGGRDKLSLTLPEWFEGWLAGDSYDVWARPALRLEDESWHRSDADPDRYPIRLHPDQAPLW